jgi:hypothetical protein
MAVEYELHDLNEQQYNALRHYASAKSVRTVLYESFPERPDDRSFGIHIFAGNLAQSILLRLKIFFVTGQIFTK